MRIVAPVPQSVRATREPWQAALQTAVREVADLCRRLDLPDEFARPWQAAGPSFPVFVPLGYLAKIRPGDPRDPLLLQVLPDARESGVAAGDARDPVGDAQSVVSAGLLQKYSGRVLFLTTGACAIHCRYCFRQNFPYQEGPAPHLKRLAALEAIAADPTVEEVIFSGGDPLTLPDGQLAELARRLSEIPHVRRLRIHTRLPIVIPERVTAELLAWLRGTRLVPWVVVHANHPHEIDPSVAEALTQLVDHGIPVLNQSVLLRGVNDEVEVLAELSRRLIDVRVTPYYLHQLDRVAGASRFEVPVARGLSLMEGLRERLPGYAVPRYVHERAGDVGKSWL